MPKRPTEHLTAAEFKAACQEGGEALEAALLQMDRAYFSVCFRDSLRVLRDEQRALDAVQEGFIKVWLRCASFRADTEVLPWVRAVVRNTVLDLLRRARPHAHESLDDTHGDLRPEVELALLRQSGTELANQPDQVLGEAQADAVFRACLERFEREAPEHAQVLRWIAEDGLKPADVALLIERTPGATREFISQARKKARHVFAEWHAMLRAQEVDQHG